MNRKIKVLFCLILFLLLMAPFLIPATEASATGTPKFSDLQGHWAECQIIRLADLGMVKGYHDRTFRPDQPVSQMEALVMLVSSAGYNPVKVSQTGSRTKSKSPASTVKASWGQPYLDLAIDKGFLQTQDSNAFDCDAPASRLYVARLLGRVLFIDPPLNAATFTINSNTGPTQNLGAAAFKDEDSIPAADRLLLKALVSYGIITGYQDGTFRPDQTVSRAELATILCRLIDQGWIQTKQGQQQTGWISQVIQSKKINELSLTSLSGTQKYNLSKSVKCFKSGENWPVNLSYGYRCQVMLNSSKQVVWINLLDQKTPSDNPVKLRGSIKSIIMGKDNFLIISDLICGDHLLPVAWDAALTAKNTAIDFNSLKLAAFVDVEICQGQIKKVNVLDTKTLSDTIEKIDGGRLYFKAGTVSANRPGWINNWSFARMIDNNNMPIDSLSVGDSVQITYLDPDPKGIDDEIPLEIKDTSKK